VVPVASKGDESEDSVVVKPLTQEPVVRTFFVRLVCSYFQITEVSYQSVVLHLEDVHAHPKCSHGHIIPKLTMK